MVRPELTFSPVVRHCRRVNARLGRSPFAFSLAVCLLAGSGCSRTEPVPDVKLSDDRVLTTEEEAKINGFGDGGVLEPDGLEPDIPAEPQAEPDTGVEPEPQMLEPQVVEPQMPEPQVVEPQPEMSCDDERCQGQPAVCEGDDRLLCVDVNGCWQVQDVLVGYCKMVPEDCGNKLDDNGDGLVDCQDPDCASSDLCQTCSARIDQDLGSAFGEAVATGNTSRFASSWTATCGDGAGSPDFSVMWTAPQSNCYRVTTDGSNYDTTLHIHSECPEASEEYCSDDVGDNVLSEVMFTTEEGTSHIIVVDGYSINSSGSFVLNVVNCDEICGDGEDNDQNGLTDCADPVCQALSECVSNREDCTNLIDDDNDGAVDCQDADCSNTAPCLEVCDDGVDNDADGAIDCADSDCTMQPECSTCPAPQASLGSILGDAVAVGSTLAQANNHYATCANDSPGPDVVLSWVAPDTGCYDLSTEGSNFDTSLHIHAACPSFSELECDDDDGNALYSRIRMNMDADQEYLIVVDGYEEGVGGSYQLNIQQCVEDCSDGVDNNLDGFIDCADADCEMASVCIPEVCNNGLDDDGDGAVDCIDSECVGVPDCIEICDDGLDNNQNGLIDCADPDCAGEPVCETAPTADEDLGSVTGYAVATGSTTYATADYSATCAAGAASPDVMFSWVAPSDGCYVFDTQGSGYDTALHLRSSPGFEELACNDDAAGTYQSEVSYTVTAGQTYFIIVDGYSNDSYGTFQLNISTCN